ncbi:tyrosine-type recombinase/integrase [Arthrobacter sp. UM1]|nr:tyrosine-type recombinase/integrase [Arthrobacter sp. UM1]
MDPMDRVPRVKRPRLVPRPITAADISRLVESSRRLTRVKILLAALAGLRVHEIAKIRGEDIDLDARTLTVEGKGGHIALIPLHPQLVEIAQGMPRIGFWFPSETRRGHVHARAVGKAIQRAIDRAGADGTPHQLRHWYGSSLLASGADLRTVQELMRHVSIQSTQIYTLVPDERRHEAVSRLSIAA